MPQIFRAWLAGWAVGGEGNVRAPKGEMLGRDQLWAGAGHVIVGFEDFMGQLGRGYYHGWDLAQLEDFVYALVDFI